MHPTALLGVVARSLASGEVRVIHEPNVSHNDRALVLRKAQDILSWPDATWHHVPSAQMLYVAIRDRGFPHVPDDEP